jgi:hypothetical protein
VLWVRVLSCILACGFYIIASEHITVAFYGVGIGIIACNGHVVAHGYGGNGS